MYSKNFSYLFIILKIFHIIFIDTTKIILYKKLCGWDSRLFRCHLVFPMPNKLQFLRQMEHGWYYHLSYDLSWLYKGSLIFGIVRNTENDLKAPKEQTIPRLLGFLKRKLNYWDFAGKMTITEEVLFSEPEIRNTKIILYFWMPLSR